MANKYFIGLGALGSDFTVDTAINLMQKAQGKCLVQGGRVSTSGRRISTVEANRALQYLVGYACLRSHADKNRIARQYISYGASVSKIPNMDPQRRAEFRLAQEAVLQFTGG